MIKNQLFIAAALFAGVAIGYLMKPAAPAETPDVKTPVAAAKIDDAGAQASVKALRARIAELEKLLAAKQGGAERPGEEAVGQPVEQVAGAQPVEAARGERRGPPSMQSMREHMEKMAKEDPERFAQITNRMAQWRQRRIERANAKLDFLSTIDTSGMTSEQKKTHETYQELLVRREELEEKMHSPGITDDDREDILREMREMDHAMRQAARTERETLIGQATQALGFTGDEAKTVSETIGDIISSTEQTHGFGPPPPNGGPGGPGGGSK